MMNGSPFSEKDVVFFRCWFYVFIASVILIPTGIYGWLSFILITTHQWWVILFLLFSVASQAMCLFFSAILAPHWLWAVSGLTYYIIYDVVEN